MNPPDHPPKWELLHSESLSEYEVFSVRRDRARNPKDGAIHDYHVVESPEGVAMIALTPEEDLVLVEQYRHPFRERTLEVPSGIKEPEEDAVAAGIRELQEETGYEGEDARLLGTVKMNPSWQTTLVHVVLITVVRPRGQKNLDAGEDTRVRTASFDEVQRLVREGEIRSAAAMSALVLYLWGEGGG